MTNDLLINLSVEQGSLPRKLYKYRSFDSYTNSLFSNNQLWFASVPTFNDPFDGQIQDAGTYSRDDILSYLEQQNLSEPEKTAILLHEAQNPGFVHNIVEESKSNALNRRGVLSLSQRNNDILMWAHYCASHSGFVLGFDVLQDTDFFMTPFRVRYQDEYPAFQYIKEQNKILTHGILTKSSHWAYEQEVRIIKASSGLHQFNPAALREVILGARITDDSRTLISSVLSDSRYAHVTISQASCSQTNYSLDINRMSA